MSNTIEAQDIFPEEITKEIPQEALLAARLEEDTVVQCMYWIVQELLQDKEFDGKDFAPGRRNPHTPCGDCQVCWDFSRFLIEVKEGDG